MSVVLNFAVRVLSKPAEEVLQRIASELQQLLISAKLPDVGCIWCSHEEDGKPKEGLRLAPGMNPAVEPKREGEPERDPFLPPSAAPVAAKQDKPDNGESKDVASIGSAPDVPGLSVDAKVGPKSATANTNLEKARTTESPAGEK